MSRLDGEQQLPESVQTVTTGIYLPLPSPDIPQIITAYFPDKILDGHIRRDRDHLAPPLTPNKLTHSEIGTGD